MTFRRAGDQLGRERLLAVRTHHLVRGAMCGEIRHGPTVPASPGSGENEAVGIERRPLRFRRLAPRLTEVNQPEEAFPIRQADRFASGFGPQNPRRPPIPGEAARVCREQNDIDRARRSAHTGR